MRATTLFFIALFFIINLTVLVNTKKSHNKSHKAHAAKKVHNRVKKAEKACLGGPC
jgi:preprotein translocase subunit SecG